MEVCSRDGKPMEESCGIKHPVQQWIIGILEWLVDLTGYVSGKLVDEVEQNGFVC